MHRNIFGALCALVLLTGTAAAGEPVYLFVTADGEAIKGESSTTSLGRKDGIECFTVATSLVRVDSGQGAGQGPLRGGQLSCAKAIGKSTPALLRALVGRARADVVAKFYRPNPIGDGTTEQFYTITARGQLVSVEQKAAAGAVEPPMETITFDFEVMTFTAAGGGAPASARF
jgi:type VI secretion system secreted protein Hcp